MLRESTKTADDYSTVFPAEEGPWWFKRPDMAQWDFCMIKTTWGKWWCDPMKYRWFWLKDTVTGTVWAKATPPPEPHQPRG